MVQHWTEKQYNTKVVGALLVAPADVDSKVHTPEVTWNFAPIPTKPLPYPSIVISSSNDPYVELAKAELLAMHWNSQFINVGPQGHLNS